MKIASMPEIWAGQNTDNAKQAIVGEWFEDNEATESIDYDDKIDVEEDQDVLEYSAWSITLTQDEIREAVKDQLASDLYDDLVDLGDPSSHPPGDFLDIARNWSRGRSKR